MPEPHEPTGEENEFVRSTPDLSSNLEDGPPSMVGPRNNELGKQANEFYNEDKILARKILQMEEELQELQRHIERAKQGSAAIKSLLEDKGDQYTDDQKRAIRFILHELSDQQEDLPAQRENVAADQGAANDQRDANTWRAQQHYNQHEVEYKSQAVIDVSRETDEDSPDYKPGRVWQPKRSVDYPPYTGDVSTAVETDSPEV